jgi:hypothetical protein
MAGRTDGAGWQGATARSSWSGLGATRGMVGAMIAVAGLGLTLAALLAEGDVWAMPTLSHLGADPGSGPIFRLTMLIVGGLAVLVAWRLGGVLERLARGGRIGRRWERLYRLVLWVTALGFLGVAAFPLGMAPLVELAHGTAAYAIPISMLIPMLTARVAIPDLDQPFGRASLLVIASSLLLYLAALASLIPYFLMEAIAFGLGAGWFVVFAWRLAALDEGLAAG